MIKTYEVLQIKLYIKNFKMKGLFVVVVFVGLVGNSRKSNVLQMIMLSFP